jgi:hypothetical protein
MTENNERGEQIFSLITQIIVIIFLIFKYDGIPIGEIYLSELLITILFTELIVIAIGFGIEILIIVLIGIYR